MPNIPMSSLTPKILGSVMKKAAFLLLSLITQTALADLSLPGIRVQETQGSLSLKDAALAKTGLSFNEEDLTDEQNSQALNLTPAQIHEAKVWGLTLEEERRYVFLMQNRSGVYYKGLNLTPVDILGIHAKSEQERQHFASLSAKQEAQKVAKNIAWNNAFHKAYSELFKNIPVVGDVDLTPYAPMAYKPVTLSSGDNLFFFLKPNDSLTSVFYALTDAIESTPNTRLHLMFLEADDLAIQQWANRHQLSRSLVSQARVTLNHGEFQYGSLKTPQQKTPLLLLARAGSSSIVDLGRF